MTPRSTYVKLRRRGASAVDAVPIGWHCIICVRIAMWRAHFGPDKPVPRKFTKPESYLPQSRAPEVRWTDRVTFESGASYATEVRYSRKAVTVDLQAAETG